MREQEGRDSRVRVGGLVRRRLMAVVAIVVDVVGDILDDEEDDEDKTSARGI